MLGNTLDVVVNGTTHSTSLASLTDNRSVRQELGANLALPFTLTISRNTTGKGAKAIDSYLIRLDQTVSTVVDASSNIMETGTISAYMVVKVPRAVSQSRANARHLAKAIATWTVAIASDGPGTDNINRILAGEL